MSEYRQKLEVFVWPSCLKPIVQYLARDRGGPWWWYECEPFQRVVDSEHGLVIGGVWTPVEGDFGCARFLDLPEGSEPLLLCRDDYVTNSEATTLDATAMEKALRKISRIANASLAPIEQDAALEIIASECYEVLCE